MNGYSLKSYIHSARLGRTQDFSHKCCICAINREEEQINDIQYIYAIQGEPFEAQLKIFVQMSPTRKYRRLRRRSRLTPYSREIVRVRRFKLMVISNHKIAIIETSFGKEIRKVDRRIALLNCKGLI